MTTKTREIAAQALEGGISPLDYMLQILRDETLQPGPRFEAAKAAAPYVHPRLANIEADVHGKLGVTVEIIRFGDARPAS